MKPATRAQWRKLHYAVRVLALVALPVLLAAALIIPIRNMITTRETLLITQLATLARLKAGYAQAQTSGLTVLPGVETSLVADYLSGTQDAVIVADLQSRLRTLAMSRSVELNSANTLPQRTVKGITYIGLRIIVRGQLSDLQHVLYGIESSKPLLFVEKFNLRVDTWPMRSAETAIDGAPALISEIDIYGAKIPISGPAQQLATAAAMSPAPSDTTGSPSATQNPSATNSSAPLPLRTGRRP